MFIQYNKSMTLNRVNALKRSVEKYQNYYCEFMQEMLEKGYAKKVPESVGQSISKVWFIPHHDVYHAKKPEKICVVFDCRAQFMGES